jgi:hypothetical protein
MRTASLLLLLLLAARALAQPAPVLQLQPLSEEILISVSDVASRLRPAVAADRAGRFVVAWREIEGQDGGIAGRRLSTTGFPASPGFVVAPRETGLHTSDPRIVARSDGGFLVAWGEAAFLRPGCARARSFSAGPGDTAEPAGEVFALGDCTMENGRAPEVALAGLPDGRFLAAWESGQAMAPPPTGGFTVLVRQVAATGVPLAEALGAAEPKEGGPAAGEQIAPAVTVHADGGAFVLWLDRLRAALLGRRFAAGGQPLGPSFRVDTAGFPVQAAVATSLSGRSVVAWSAFTGQEMRIVAQLFDAGGRKHGEPIPVSLPASSSASPRDPRDPRDPDVALDAAGNFIVVWDADQADGAGRGVLGRLFDSAGVPQGPPFQINLTRPGSQGHPAVAFGRDDHFLVVWESQKNADARGSIVGRLYLVLRTVVPSNAPE